jgi:HK97 family phage major capsid protein
MGNAREVMPVNATAAANKFSLLALLAGERYEVGLSKIAGDKYGQPQARGLAVPHRRMIRDLGVSSSAAGGALASATELQRVAAAVRPAVVLEQMGAERIEVSGAGEVAFPKFSGGQGSWLAEGESSPTDNATIDSVVAVPHCAAARLGMSRRVRNGAREDIEAAVLRELEQCVGATLEAGFLTGTGTNDQPLGLIFTPGIGAQSFASSVPTLAELVAMIETYGDANGDLTAARWLLHPSDLADLLKALVDADGGELIVQWQDGAHRICGLPVFTTSHLTEGKHLLMDPSAVALVYFGGAQVLLDEYSNGKAISGAAEICTFNYADVAVLRPAHIVLGSS